MDFYELEQRTINWHNKADIFNKARKLKNSYGNPYSNCFFNPALCQQWVVMPILIFITIIKGIYCQAEIWSSFITFMGIYIFLVRFRGNLLASLADQAINMDDLL